MVANIREYGGWQEIGTITEDTRDGRQAIALSGLDRLTYTKRKNNTELDGVQQWNGGYSIVRTDCSPNKVIAQHVGYRYSIFTPTDLMDVFNDLFAEGLVIETCGAIGNGERIWFQARMRDFISQINGEDIKRYLHGTTTFDASGSTRFFPTTFKLHCGNAHRVAMQDCDDGIALRHTKNAVNRKSEVKLALGMANRDFERYTSIGNVLASTRIDQPAYFERMTDIILNKRIAGIKATGGAMANGDIQRAIDKISDNERKHVANLALARFEKSRGSVLSRILELSQSETNSFGADDAWHSFNSVTELVDHGGLIKFRRVTGNELAQQRQLGKLFGRADQIKQSAYKIAMTLANLAS